MTTRISMVSGVGAAIAALVLAGCAAPESSASEHLSSASAHLDSAAVSEIELTFDGVPLVPKGYPAQSADAAAAWLVGILFPATVSPEACRGWHVEQALASELDVGSADELFELGGYDNGDQTPDRVNLIHVIARVFEDSASATAFLDRLLDDARACTQGYEWVASGQPVDGDASEHWTLPQSQGDLSVEKEWHLRGARVAAVQEDEVGSVVDNDNEPSMRWVYIAYGNVIIVVRAPGSNFSTREVTDEEWDDLIEQVVSGLEAATM